MAQKDLKIIAEIRESLAGCMLHFVIQKLSVDDFCVVLDTMYSTLGINPNTLTCEERLKC